MSYLDHGQSVQFAYYPYAFILANKNVIAQFFYPLICEKNKFITTIYSHDK